MRRNTTELDVPTAAVPEGSAEPAVTFHEGQQVIWGPDWRWGGQDGYEGGHVPALGEVVRVKSTGWCVIHWQLGTRDTYRTGADGMYDVVPFDAAEWEAAHPPPAPPAPEPEAPQPDTMCANATLATTMKAEEPGGTTSSFGPGSWTVSDLKKVAGLSASSGRTPPPPQSACARNHLNPTSTTSLEPTAEDRHAGERAAAPPPLPEEDKEEEEEEEDAQIRSVPSEHALSAAGQGSTASQGQESAEHNTPIVHASPRVERGSTASQGQEAADGPGQAGKGSGSKASKWNSVMAFGRTAAAKAAKALGKLRLACML